MSADLTNISLEELKKLNKSITEEIKDEYKKQKEQERQKLIDEIQKKTEFLRKMKRRR